MCNSAALPEVTDCIFTENTSAVSGGGMYNEESSPTVSYCRFEGNMAERGGGLYICEDSVPMLFQCTLTLNVAVYSGGGIFVTPRRPLPADDCGILAEMAAVSPTRRSTYSVQHSVEIRPKRTGIYK